MKIFAILILFSCLQPAEPLAAVATRIAGAAKNFLGKVKRSRSSSATDAASTAAQPGESKSFISKAVEVFTGGSLLALGGAEVYDRFSDDEVRLFNLH